MNSSNYNNSYGSDDFPHVYICCDQDFLSKPKKLHKMF